MEGGEEEEEEEERFGIYGLKEALVQNTSGCSPLFQLYIQYKSSS